jgi:hypothetical protein
MGEERRREGRLREEGHGSKTVQFGSMAMGEQQVLGDGGASAGAAIDSGGFFPLSSFLFPPLSPSF